METLPNLEIVRAVPRAASTKDDTATEPLLEVRFSKFNEWYEINSFFEGNFMERTAPGAFSKTIEESRSQIKVLFDHGYDPTIGNKVLGTIEDLREDSDTPVGEVRMFDTSYNRDLLPGLRAGAYGSSMRMRVVKDEWDKNPPSSDHNPKGIPERTIREVRLFEFGPVTFPANPESTSGVRSMTDEFYSEMRSRDPQRVDELMRSRESMIALQREAQPAEATARTNGAAETTTTEPPAHSAGLTPGERRRRIHLNRKEQ